LMKLERDDLVESAPMHGARVTPLTPERVRNSQVLREAIECQAARLCAQNADKKAFDGLLELAIPLDQAMQKADPKSMARTRQHMEFHLAIAEASGASVLVHQLTRLWYCRFMHLIWINVAQEPVPEDWHQQLVRALATRDPDIAEAAMREHVMFGNDRHLEALQKMNDSGELTG
ncbi:unnamed protein product, partial [marine sediment metagenome]